MLETYFQQYLDRYQHYKNGKWCYEDGCIYRGLELLHRVTGNDLWLDHLLGLIDQQVSDQGELRDYHAEEYNIDNILSGRALLYLSEITGQEKYKAGCEHLASQLATHPRTESGVYWHKLRYPHQIWLDGLYMGPPFQIGYGLVNGKPELISDAIHQVSTALDISFGEEDGLYIHAVDEAREQPWADPVTGRSGAYWARSLGWLSMGLVDILASADDELTVALKERTADLLKKIYSLRQSSGLWYQVIDQPELPGNYLETSASAMFVYALMCADQLGLIEINKEHLLRELVGSSVRVDDTGRYRMVDICEVAGLGYYENRFRDGSAEYYLSERKVDNDAKGVGPLMMCWATARI